MSSPNQTRARPAAACGSCGAASPLRVEITTTSGAALVMSSCTSCERRTWSAGGEAVELPEVLRLAAGDSAFAVIPAQRRQPGVRRTS